MFEENNPNNPIRIAFYIRVSTDEQAKDGYGIEMQLDSLRDLLVFNEKNKNWVHKKEWEYIDDGYSGSDLNRPHFKRMIEDIKNKKFDIVVVWKIDRLSRNLSHLLKVFEDIKKYDVSLYSLKENIDFSGPIGKLTFQIFGALAEFERETIKMRTLDGKMASARQGNYVGGSIPFGYKKVENKLGKGSKLETVEKEAYWIGEIFKMFVYRGMNYCQIAEELNNLKVPKGINSKNKDKHTKWRDKMVSRILTDRIYTGLNQAKFTDENKKEVIIDQKIPKIISDLDYRQAIFISENVSNNRGGGLKEYLLSRKIVFLDSGNTLIGYSRTKGGSGYRHKKTVRNGVEYPNIEIPAKAIEDFVWDWCKTAINRPKDFAKAYELQTSDSKELKTLLEEEKLLDKQICDLDNAIDNVRNDFYQGGISESKQNKFISDYTERIAGLEKAKNRIKKRLEQLLEIQKAKDAVEKLSEEFNKKIVKESFDFKKRIINTLVESIVVSLDKDKNIVIDIKFKFAHQKDNNSLLCDEPENIKNTIKKDRIDEDSAFYGGQ